MVKVFFTIDTEIWPRSQDWQETSLEKEMDFYIYGRTRIGDFGLEYQMDVLDSCGLKGVFLVESIFSDAVGLKPLKRIVKTIRDKDHEVQLHIHPEWLGTNKEQKRLGQMGINMLEFSAEEQYAIIKKGVENLRKSGADKICAFRAGNYGANIDTLGALSRNNILFDTSFNYGFINAHRELSAIVPVLQPQYVNGAYEFPISYFRDWKGQLRHLQLTACTINELKSVLLHAWKQRWFHVVIVSHSFELLKPVSGKSQIHRPDRIVINRFEQLCRFLEANNDKFEIATFTQLNADTIPANNTRSREPYISGLFQTACRHIEQFARRIY